MADKSLALCAENRKLSVCIVSHNGLGAISGGRSGFIGGVEWQTALLARWLANQGHRVTLLTWRDDGPPEEMFGDVRVLKLCRKDEGFPGLRFFHPKWTSLLKAMRQADADVYYHNCGECVTGQIALWCRRNGRPFVFSAASEADCRKELPELRTRRERALYLRGIRLADRIIVQTQAQQRLLDTNFSLASCVIPMPCPDSVTHELDAFRRPNAEKRVLWLGRVCAVKRPDRLVDIARACPDVQFDLAGPIYDDTYAKSVIAKAELIPNIRVHGAVQRDRVPEMYRQASLLCCTSEYEGFPNTFLEAWSHGVPVVSTVDPDGVIIRHGLGLVGDKTSVLADGIRTFLSSETDYISTSQRARQYFVNHHAMEVVMPRIEHILLEVARARQRA